MPNTETPNTDRSEGASSGQRREAPISQIDERGVLADQQLVARCLAGEVKAWEELYHQCHRALLASIKVLLGRGECDLNLVDEIAARVWYGLVAENGKLLARFDAQRGCRLTTFLATIARSEAKGHFRTERRRRNREAIASRSESDAHNLGKEPAFGAMEEFLSSVTMEEFIKTLTPRERGFFTGFLLASPSESDSSLLSPLSIRQLRHRVHQKLRRFLSDRS